MVTILVKSGSQVAGSQRYGEHVSSYRASPLLELPSSLPQQIEVKGFLQGYKDKRSAGEAYDETLSNVLREVLGNDYPRLNVGYIVCGEGTMPIIDPGMACNRFAVGPRLEMLHNQFGIGEHILYLLDNAPLSMMLPDHQERDFLACTYGQSDLAQDRLWDNDKPQLLTGLFPKWVHNPRRMRNLPDNLPPRLNDILKRCKVEQWNQPLDTYYGDEDQIGWWPFAVICWHGFEPYQDRRTKRMVAWNFDYGSPDARQRELDNRIPDMSQGGDISWMALDNLIKSNENYIHNSCMPEVHTFDAAENLLYSFSPFYELLKYISHDQD